jgi:hypothetical protein
VPLAVSSANRANNGFSVDLQLGIGPDLLADERRDLATSAGLKPSFQVFPLEPKLSTARSPFREIADAVSQQRGRR